ncbi:MAG: pseudouridine synthase [Cyclobacteriaceae bacterium]
MSKKATFRYFIIHKPFRVLSQFTDEDGNPGLGSIFKLPKDVYPVGRLDLDSEGLLLLTNDRSLNHQLLHPKFKHGRTYWAEVDGVPDQDALDNFEKGLQIKAKGKSYFTEPANIRLLNAVHLAEREPAVNRVKHPVTTWVEINLIEGKNRQVRKMTAAIGHPTLRLIRIGIESLKLGELISGGIQELAEEAVYHKLGIKRKPFLRKGLRK